MQRYLFHVRQMWQPRTGRAAEKLLLAYYQMQRRVAGRSSGRTTIRMLESLLRLAQVPYHMCHVL
jgi:DNA helicase MCM9